MSIERLTEIHRQMMALLAETRETIRALDPVVYKKADRAWMAHLEMALTRDHEYLGSADGTMEDTISELAGSERE